MSLGLFLSYCMIAAFAVNPLMAGLTGIDSILDALRKPRRLLVMTGMVAVMTMLTTVCFYPIDVALPGEDDAKVIRGVIYCVIVLVVFIIADKALKAVAPTFYKGYGDLLAPACFNGMAVGVPLVILYCDEAAASFALTLAMGFGAVLGFALAAFFVYEGIRIADNPDLSPNFRGAPILLIYIGILSLAFCALLGDITLFKTV